MTVVTKTIGRLPQYIGDWEQRTSPNGYKRRNRVTMFGSEFESLSDNNTQVPATYNSSTGVITVNTTYWKVISNALGAYVIDQQWPAKEQEMEDFKTAVNTSIAGKLDASQKGAASGVASLDSNTKVPIAQIPTGANGVATLDNAGKVPTSQLPSYVDDVIEAYYYNGAFYTTAAHTTQITPESDKIYIDIPSSICYRWSGSQYIAISNPDTYTKAEVNALLAGKQNSLSVVPAAYSAVTDTTGKNPAQEGWYELVDSEYVLTEDTTPASGKTYYKVKYYELTW